MDIPSFPTPEAAAMAEWDNIPRAKARVVSVDYTDDDHATVVTDTDPHYLMWNHCARTEDGWVFMGDHN